MQSMLSKNRWFLVPHVRHEGAPGCCSLPNGERVDKVLIISLFAAPGLVPIQGVLCGRAGRALQGRGL